MGMAVVAKFTDQRQAESAAGALRSAGYEAQVYDYPAGGDVPGRVLGDFRLAVREDQSDDALTLLRDIHDEAPVHEPSEPVSLWGPSVVITPPPGAEPVHWRLLTTHEVTTLEQARQIVARYRMRWIIEQVFRSMKADCLRIEDSQLETAACFTKLAMIGLIAPRLS